MLELLPVERRVSWLEVMLYIYEIENIMEFFYLNYVWVVGSSLFGLEMVGNGDLFWVGFGI